jgi:hypothetical protein
MYSYASHCTDALILSRRAFFLCVEQFDSLYVYAEKEKRRADDECQMKENARDSLKEENQNKRIWRRVAIGEGILIVGVTAGVITGAIIPAAIGVIAGEAMLCLIPRKKKN